MVFSAVPHIIEEINQDNREHFFIFFWYSMKNVINVRIIYKEILTTLFPLKSYFLKKRMKN